MFRLLAGFLSAALVAALLTSCVPSTPSSRSVEVDPTSAATLEIEGALRVEVPAGSVDAAGVLTVSREGTSPARADGIAALQAWEITLDGATIVAPIEISFVVPADSVGASIGYFDEAAGVWTLVESSRSDDGWVVASADHLSWWQPWTWNLDAVGNWIKEKYLDLATPDGVKDPECVAESSASDLGIKVVADDGALVRSCVGLADGRIQFKVTNARFYGLGLFYPLSWSVAGVEPVGGIVSTAIATLASAVPPGITPDGYGWMTLGPGQTAELTASPGSVSMFNVQPDPVSYLASALVFGVETFAMTLGKSPVGPRPDPTKSEAALKAVVENSACIDDLSEFVTNEWDGFDGSFAGFKTTLEIAFGCLAPSWQKAYGLEGIVGTFVMSVITWLISGAALVAQAVSAIVDSLANIDGFDLNVHSGSLDSNSWVISSEGVGPLKIGGTREDLERIVDLSELQYPDGYCGADVARVGEWSLAAGIESGAYEFYVLFAGSAEVGPSTADGITFGSSDADLLAAGWQPLGILQKVEHYGKTENGVPMRASMYEGGVQAIGVGLESIPYEVCG
jgi:hypothetical protein